MKLTATFLLIMALQVSATGFSQDQKVSIRLKKATISSIFAEIEKQSNCRFVYSNDLLDGNRKVDVNVKDETISNVLQTLLYNTGVNYVLMDKNLIVLKKLTEVNDVIIGKVLLQNGSPAEGITITVKGTNNQTATNAQGVFRLDNVSPNAVLVVTGINIETEEVRLNGRKSVDVTVKLRIVTADEVEVISTGYQTISKERATGAFDVVGQDVLSKRPVSNLSTALYGIVAGMQGKENSDGSVSYLIRGTSSMYANTSPLIVVDGFPITESNFSSINPNDVESITILKDAAAASIWGARSANGVVVIVTKKPKLGRLKIEANAFARISSYIDMEQLLVQANSADHIRYEKLAWDNNWVLSPYAGTLQQIGSSLTLAQEYMWQRKQGLISEAQMNAGLDSLSRISNRQQVKDYLLQRGILNQYNLAISGSTDRSRTYASILYEKNKGDMVKNGYDRFMFNFTNSYQPFKFLELSLSAFINYNKSQSSGASISEIQGLSPYETLLNPDGSYAVNLTMNREQLATLPLNVFPYSDWNYNLLREVRGRNFTSETIGARFQTGATFKIAKGLSFDTRFQYERRNINSENYYSEDSYTARNAVNTMAKYNQTTRRVDTFYIPKGGQLRAGESKVETFLVRNQLNFNHTFAKDHEITFLIGSEISSATTTSVTYPYAYGYYPEKLQSSVPQYGYGGSTDIFRNFLNNTATIAGANTVFGWGKTKFVSFYGNTGYTYKGKYSITGSVRSDASNYITDDPALRWSPMWSVGILWNAKREAFFSNIPDLNRLMVRLTYGRNGNAESSTSTKTLVNVSSGLSTTTGTITASISDYGNPALRWEKTTTTNLGFDFAMFKNRLFGKLDLYTKHGTDITGLVTLPSATGVTSQKFNNAEIVNKGFEIEIGTRLNITDKFVYEPVITYAYNNNEITKLYYPNLYAYSLIDGTFVQGRPMGALYSYTYAGMIDGAAHVYGPNKTPSTFNAVTLHNNSLGLPFLNFEGTTIPPHTFGWLNNFAFGDFYATALFVGKFGGVYRNPTFNYSTTVGSSKTYINKFVADVFAGDPSIPGFGLPNNTQTYLWDRYAPNLSVLVESSSFIECKEISLGYNLPKSLLNKISFSGAKVFAQARNLGLVYKANSKNYHPEWLPGSFRPIPTFSIGANLQF